MWRLQTRPVLQVNTRLWHSSPLSGFHETGLVWAWDARDDSELEYSYIYHNHPSSCLIHLSPSLLPEVQIVNMQQAQQIPQGWEARWSVPPSFVQHVADRQRDQQSQAFIYIGMSSGLLRNILTFRPVYWEITMGGSHKSHLPHRSSRCRSSSTCDCTRSSTSRKTAVPDCSDGSSLRRSRSTWRRGRRLPTASSTTCVSRSKSSRRSYPAIHPWHGRK